MFEVSIVKLLSNMLINVTITISMQTIHYHTLNVNVIIGIVPIRIPVTSIADIIKKYASKESLVPLRQSDLVAGEHQ